MWVLLYCASKASLSFPSLTATQALPPPPPPRYPGTLSAPFSTWSCLALVILWRRNQDANTQLHLYLRHHLLLFHTPTLVTHTSLPFLYLVFSRTGEIVIRNQDTEIQLVTYRFSLCSPSFPTASSILLARYSFFPFFTYENTLSELSYQDLVALVVFLTYLSLLSLSLHC